MLSLHAVQTAVYNNHTQADLLIITWSKQIVDCPEVIFIMRHYDALACLCWRDKRNQKVDIQGTNQKSSSLLSNATETPALLT